MKVRNIMSTRIATVNMDTTLETIAEVFHKAHFHHLLVMDNGELAGVISDRDVLKHISPFIGTLSEQQRDLGTMKKHAHQIMSRDPIKVTPNQSLQEATQILLDNNISCLPVIEAKKVVGIMTWKDILKHAVHSL